MRARAGTLPSSSCRALARVDKACTSAENDVTVRTRVCATRPRISLPTTAPFPGRALSAGFLPRLVRAAITKTREIFRARPKNCRLRGRSRSRRGRRRRADGDRSRRLRPTRRSAPQREAGADHRSFPHLGDRRPRSPRSIRPTRSHWPPRTRTRAGRSATAASSPSPPRSSISAASTARPASTRSDTSGATGSCSAASTRRRRPRIPTASARAASARSSRSTGFRKDLLISRGVLLDVASMINGNLDRCRPTSRSPPSISGRRHGTRG